MKSNELPQVNGGYTFVTDEVELDMIVRALGISDFADSITAALVAVSEGDYEHVFLTDCVNLKRSANWDWYAPEFFDDMPDEELYLQD